MDRGRQRESNVKGQGRLQERTETVRWEHNSGYSYEYAKNLPKNRRKEKHERMIRHKDEWSQTATIRDVFLQHGFPVRGRHVTSKLHATNKRGAWGALQCSDVHAASVVQRLNWETWKGAWQAGSTSTSQACHSCFTDINSRKYIGNGEQKTKEETKDGDC